MLGIANAIASVLTWFMSVTGQAPAAGQPPKKAERYEIWYQGKKFSEAPTKATADAVAKALAGRGEVRGPFAGAVLLANNPAPGTTTTPGTTTPAAPAPDPLRVPRGQAVFDAEGNDDPASRYYSRRPHVPDGNSGLTIGRGYDLRERTAASVIADLTAAGLTDAQARLYAGGVGLQGQRARDYVAANTFTVARAELYERAAGLTGKALADFRKANNLTDAEAARYAPILRAPAADRPALAASMSLPEITREQQNALFLISYGQKETYVGGVYGRANGSRPNAVAWADLSPAVRETVVDLGYRGDYVPRNQTALQDLIAANDLRGLATYMGNRDNWPNVPQDRFNRRRDAINAAVAALPPLPAPPPVPTPRPRP